MKSIRKQNDLMRGKTKYRRKDKEWRVKSKERQCKEGEAQGERWNGKEPDRRDGIEGEISEEEIEWEAVMGGLG